MQLRHQATWFWAGTFVALQLVHRPCFNRYVA
jgi:hypothetical protein